MANQASNSRHGGSVPGHRVIHRDRVDDHDNYCVQRRDKTGRLGLSTLQKVTAAFRILAYGVPADATDEYIQIGESRGFPGMLGSLDWSNNDINLLEASHLFANLANGIAPPAHYVIQGEQYHTGYYLADDEHDEQADIKRWREAPAIEVDIRRDETTLFQEFLARHRQIKDREAHYALRNALIEHL
ncbi:PREDICTED: uncharacterized protein LOC109192647 [Ipomoea nil]|uniref:uncharacterized protein LOC109192647 n=1 Tax=Ipomoea nil TaxID=35883 RepID=UPI000901AEAC|nr:PREDICTED: uncharacterized protein LOC109192647 [Ipomoea nil]